jgi:hypothetical protein
MSCTNNKKSKVQLCTNGVHLTGILLKSPQSILISLFHLIAVKKQSVLAEVERKEIPG